MALVRHRGAAAAVLGFIATAVGAAVLWWGGAISAAGWDTGLVDTGLTPWLLPASRLVMQAAAVVTIGCLLAAVFLVPGEPALGEPVPGEAAPEGSAPEGSAPEGSAPERTAPEGPDPDGTGRLALSAAGRAWVRAAAWSALVWAMAALAAMCFTISDLLGLPVTTVVTPSAVFDLALTTETGRVLVAVLLLAALTAAACRSARTVTGAAVAGLLALAAVLPPAFSGHAASSSNHQVAVSAMLLHVVGAVGWTGGLLALLLGRGRPTDALARSARRFSRLALTCFLLVGASGVLSAALRLPDWAAVTSSYGILVLIKSAALVTLGVLGWRHRRRSLGQLAEGRSGAFATLLWIEGLIMAATIGLAAALSRTPAPDAGAITDPLADSARPLLAPVLDWAPEPLFLTAAIAGVGWYLAGVRRLRRAGAAWPLGRTLSWAAGWLVAVAATQLQLATTGQGTFLFVEKVQHLAIAVAAPLLLAAGGPVTVARRALRPASEPGMRGPREWLTVLRDTRLARLVTEPTVALGLYAAAMFGVYAGATYTYSLRTHAGHLGVYVGALLVGCLFMWLVGAGVTPPAVSGSTRLGMVLVAAMLTAVVVFAYSRSVPPPDLTVAAALLVPVLGFVGWRMLGGGPRARATSTEAEGPLAPV